MAVTEQSVKLHNRAGVKTGLNSRRFLRTNPIRAGHTLKTKQPTLKCLNILLSETYSLQLLLLITIARH